jgi:hypothetical protein
MSNDKLPTVPPAPKRKLPPVQLSVAPDDGQLPVVARAPNPIKALHKFADRSEDLGNHYFRLMAASEKLGLVIKYPHTVDGPKIMETARVELRKYDNYFREEAKELERQRDTFDPSEAYDEEGDVLEDRVWKHIGLLVSSFPNANPGNADAYVGAMVGEVLTVSFSEMALKLACSQIRKTKDFTPTTAEVIKAIEEQQEQWAGRSMAITCCDEVAEELREELKVATELVAAEEVKREEACLAAEAKKRADDELRAQPLVLGDRVNWCHRHCGGVIVNVLNDFGDVMSESADVVFDDAFRQRCFL